MSSEEWDGKALCVASSPGTCVLSRSRCPLSLRTDHFLEIMIMHLTSKKLHISKEALAGGEVRVPDGERLLCRQGGRKHCVFYSQLHPQCPARCLACGRAQWALRG